MIDSVIEFGILFFTFVGVLVTLWYSYGALRNDAKSRNLQILMTTFNKLQEIEAEYDKNKSEPQKKKIDPRFFNTLELFAYLVNHKFVDRTASAFFEEAFVGWYKTIFLKHSLKEKVDNPNKFSEMKLLYSKLTSSKSAPGLTDRSSLALERLTVAVAFFTCVLSSAEIYNILKDWLIAPSVTSMLAAVSLLLTLVLLLAVYAAFEIMRSKK